MCCASAINYAEVLAALLNSSYSEFHVLYLLVLWSTLIDSYFIFVCIICATSFEVGHSFLTRLL